MSFFFGVDGYICMYGYVCRKMTDTCLAMMNARVGVACIYVHVPEYGVYTGH